MIYLDIEMTNRMRERKRVARRMLRDALLMLLAFLALTALFHLGR
jgi:hypothetical protein